MYLCKSGGGALQLPTGLNRFEPDCVSLNYVCPLYRLPCAMETNLHSFLVLELDDEYTSRHSRQLDTPSQ